MANGKKKKVSRTTRVAQQKRIKEKHGAGSKEHLAAMERTRKATPTKKSKDTSTDKDNAKKKRDTDRDTGSNKKKSTTSKGPFFFGTNIPLSSVKNSGKREDINNRLKADIAAGDWEGANDALFSAAFNTVRGGQGQGNPNVSKVHSGEWKVNKSPISWAETAIDSANDYYPQKDGSVVTWDDKLGALKDGVSSGSWGGQAKGENQPRSGQAPPKAGVKGAAPIGVDTSGKQSALRQRGLRDLNTIFGAGTTGGAGTGGAGTGGGLLGGQYGGRVSEYQVPNRSFNWQTDPTEQALMASAMGRPDLAQMMLTGQYGPLAGQQYQYGGGQTRINYGAGGAGAGLGGTGGTDGLLGPLGDTTADTGTGDTRPFHERYMAGETAFGGHEGILKRLADADAAKEASRLESLNAASQAARGGLGRGSDPRLYDQRSPLYQGNVTAAAAADQARENAFRLGGMSNQITSGSPAARAAMAASAANPMDFAGPAQAAMTASRANPYDFSAGPMWQQTGPTVSGFNPLGGAPSGAGQAAMAAAAANPMDFSPWGTPAARQAFDPIGN